ncbi:hypothetical protein AB1N83_006532 [Pleurotus pulmonarius]
MHSYCMGVVWRFHRVVEPGHDWAYLDAVSARATTYLCAVPRRGEASITPPCVISCSLHDRGYLAVHQLRASCLLLQRPALDRVATLGVSSPTLLSTEDALASCLMVKVKEPHGLQRLLVLNVYIRPVCPRAIDSVYGR